MLKHLSVSVSMSTFDTINPATRRQIQMAIPTKDPKQDGQGKAPEQAGANPNPTQMVAAPVPDERYRKVTLDEAGSQFGYNDSSKTNVTMNRIDFIRNAWQVGKKSRGAIAKELTRLTGKKVTYQIIFSATRGAPGGPVNPEAAPAVPTSPTPHA
jgi:hypothetical protein